MRLQYTKSFLYIPSASFRFEYAEEASSWDVYIRRKSPKYKAENSKDAFVVSFNREKGLY